MLNIAKDMMKIRCCRFERVLYVCGKRNGREAFGAWDSFIYHGGLLRFDMDQMLSASWFTTAAEQINLSALVSCQHTICIYFVGQKELSK